MQNLAVKITRKPYLAFASLIMLLVVIFNARAAIILGNPKGQVTLSFIYDYQCIHCHRMYQVIEKVADSNHDVKIKLYPVAVINKYSLIEATAAIAATKYPDKFQQLTTLLMYRMPLNNTASILGILKDLGLVNKNFLSTMHSSLAREQLAEGLKVMQKYHSTHIPIIIINKSNSSSDPLIFAGEQSYNTIKGAIEKCLA